MSNINHNLIKIHNRTLWVDRIDGFSDMRKSAVLGHAEFTVYMSNGSFFLVDGKEDYVEREQFKLCDELNMMQDDPE
jgi:hypothetical protein